MFKCHCYVKLVDTHGNFRFGFISDAKERGFVLLIDLNEEGASKISWDDEYARNVGINGGKDFSQLLTDTEKRLIPFLAGRRTTQQIAEEMGISPTTVRAHIRELKIKLELKTREQLFADCQGIMKTLGDAIRAIE